MGTQIGTIIFLWIFGTLAWAAPKRAGVDQQLASIQAQRESLQKQLAAARVTRPKPVAISPPVRITASAAVSPPAPIVTTIAALEPITPPFLPAPQWDCAPLADTEADELINAAAFRESLSPALLRSVIKHESGFRPCAVSVKGAQGLMQLMPATAAQFGVADPFNPRQNIGGGAALLRQLLNRYSGDLKLALSAYNAGIGRVEASGGVPNLFETQNYVSGILEDLGLADEDTAVETEPIAKPDPLQKESFRHITLQLSLDPKQGAKSSVQLAANN